VIVRQAPHPCNRHIAYDFPFFSPLGTDPLLHSYALLNACMCVLLSLALHVGPCAVRVAQPCTCETMCGACSSALHCMWDRPCAVHVAQPCTACGTMCGACCSALRVHCLVLAWALCVVAVLHVRLSCRVCCCSPACRTVMQSVFVCDPACLTFLIKGDGCLLAIETLLVLVSYQCDHV
jgi:hypothetical protein